MSERWLWLTAEVPIDRKIGRLVYTGGLIDAVRSADVDLVVLGLTAFDANSLAVRGVPGSLRGGWRSLFSPLPNLSYACSSPAMRDEVRAALAESWDAIVVDHLQMAWVVADLRRDRTDDAVVVFVTHNHEASVRRSVAREASSPVRRAVLAVDAIKAARLEMKMLRRADVVTSITVADRDRFACDVPDAHHVVVPPGWQGDRLAAPTPIADRPRRIGMLGSFDWHVKQENLRRFLDAADPVMAEAGVEIAIAGSIPSAVRDELVSRTQTTKFIGWVDDAAAFLDTLRVGVIAEPVGGGFKLKSLDYVFNRVPLAVTSGSVEGLPLTRRRSMIEAADERALANEIVEIVDDAPRLQSLADEALELCERRFGRHDAGRIIAAVRDVRRTN